MLYFFSGALIIFVFLLFLARMPAQSEKRRAEEITSTVPSDFRAGIAFGRPRKLGLRASVILKAYAIKERLRGRTDRDQRI